MSIPIVINNEAVGVVNFLNKTGEQKFSSKDLEVAFRIPFFLHPTHLFA